MKTIREWRAVRYMGFNELKKAAGVTSQTLSALESGSGRVPRFETMRKIAAALGVDPSEIVEFRDAAHTRIWEHPQVET